MKRILLLFSLLISLSALRAQDFSIPPFISEPLEFRTAGQDFDYWHPLLKVVEAHQRNRGAKAAVFILDTAGEFDHEDLSSEGNRFGINTTPEPPRDGHGHGHMAAGVIGMLYNNVGGVGVAPDALIIPVKVMRNTGSGFAAEIAAGIRRVADADLGEYNDRIRILNMSFGGGSAMPDVEAALAYAISKGCILVASAGNSGYQEGGQSIGFPARYEIVTSVASIGKTLQPSYFSSGGAGLDVTCFGEAVYLPNNQNNYGRYSGTSFSGPMVAGVAALIVTQHYDTFSKLGAQTNTLAQKFLRTHSTDLGPAGWDARHGYGLPEATILTKPVPGLPDTPPPTGPPTFRNVRTLATTLPATYTMVWRPADETAMRRASVSMTVEYTTQLTAPYALDTLAAGSAKYWRNRSFYLLKGDDLAEAAFWARYFYENIMRTRMGYQVRVTQLTITDEAKRSITLNNLDRRGTTATRAAAAALRLNRVQSIQE